MKRPPMVSNRHAARERLLIANHSWNVHVACTADTRLSLKDVWQASREEADQWEEVNLQNPNISTDAAVALNHFLQENTSGVQDVGPGW